MARKQYWTVREALDVAKSMGIILTSPTVIKWAKDGGFGFQAGGAGGRWYVEPQAFMTKLKGK